MLLSSKKRNPPLMQQWQNAHADLVADLVTGNMNLSIFVHVEKPIHNTVDLTAVNSTFFSPFEFNHGILEAAPLNFLHCCASTVLHRAPLEKQSCFNYNQHIHEASHHHKLPLSAVHHHIACSFRLQETAFCSMLNHPMTFSRPSNAKT
jgi:hypothetical protein